MKSGLTGKAFSRAMMGRTSITNLGILAIAAMIAVLAAEIMVRAFHKRDVQPPQLRITGGPIHEYDSLLAWRPIPFSKATYVWDEYTVTYEFNSRGIRGPERDYKTGEGQCQVLIIGDSFVFGYGVHFEDILSQVVERQLRGASARECTVVALGIEGYSTDQELLLFRREAQRYKSDITVLAFYFNDAYCNALPVCLGYDKPVFGLDDGRLILSNVPVSQAPTDNAMAETAERVTLAGPESPGALMRIKRWLNRRSRLYHLVYTTLRSRPPPVPDHFRVFKLRYDPDIRYAWQVTEALITSFRDEVTQRGSQFVLFLVPFRPNVYTDQWKSIRRTHGLSEDEWRPDRVDVQLSWLCKKHNLDCVLPTARFRQEATRLRREGKRLYYDLDWHWTREGHRLAGEIVAAHLAKRLDGNESRAIQPE